MFDPIDRIRVDVLALRSILYRRLLSCWRDLRESAGTVEMVACWGSWFSRAGRRSFFVSALGCSGTILTRILVATALAVSISLGGQRWLLWLSRFARHPMLSGQLLPAFRTPAIRSAVSFTRQSRSDVNPCRRRVIGTGSSLAREADGDSSTY